MVWLNAEDVGNEAVDVPLSEVTTPEIYVQFEVTDPKKKEITAVFAGSPKLYYFCNAMCLPQQRLTIGIGEEVTIMTLNEDGSGIGPSVNWEKSGIGAKSISTDYGNSVVLTAAKLVGPAPAKVTASIGGCIIGELDFTVLSPTGESTQYSQCICSLPNGDDLIGAADEYEVTVLPKNVCFGNIDISEETIPELFPFPNDNCDPWSITTDGFDVECDNTFFDYFITPFRGFSCFEVNWEYVDQEVVIHWTNKFPTDLGTWVNYAPVTWKCEFSPSMSFKTRTSRNGVSGPFQGPWNN